MSRLRYAFVALAALALPLLAAEKSQAQWRFGMGGWRGGYSNGWGYSPGYGYGYSYSPWINSYSSYYPYSGYSYPYSSYTYSYPYSYNSPYSSYYSYSYPYSSYNYSSPYTYSYNPYNYGSTYYTPSAYYTAPTMSSNAYVSGTGSSGTPSTTQAFYPPNSQGNMPAIIDVQVPADAQLWFDGESTSQTGGERTFRSPPLEQGQNYSYEVKARWSDNGKDVERSRRVRIHAGERVLVNFMANEEGLGAPERSGSGATGTSPLPGTGLNGTGTSPRPGSGLDGSGTSPRPGAGSDGTGTSPRPGTGSDGTGTTPRPGSGSGGTTGTPSRPGSGS
jgi:uncharacterized protein (TIGR03000 family)